MDGNPALVDTTATVFSCFRLFIFLYLVARVLPLVGGGAVLI